MNTGNGTEYAVEKGVEFYSGYSDGEYWSEGSTHENAWLSQVPRGKYVLQIEVLREPMSQPVQSVLVEVTYDVQNERNAYICVGLIVFVFVVKFLWVSYNERRRWSNSPFSPYEKE